MTITTYDTNGRPFTLITHTEPDGRLTLCVTIGSPKRMGKNIITSMVHLSETDSQALKGGIR